MKKKVYYKLNRYRNGNERIRTVHDKDVFYYAQLRRNENR